MKIYLASPFFTDDELYVYETIIDILEETEHALYVPRDHKIPFAEIMPNHLWGRLVFKNDIDAIDACDMVLALNHGLYSDSGTAWEMGYAYAKNKIIVNVVDGAKRNDHSIMTTNGSDYTITYETLFFLGIDEILRERVCRRDIVEQK